MRFRRASWPPYAMMDEDLETRAKQQLDRASHKLERLYHVGQTNVWDGREVLAQLIAKHGKPVLPPDKKDSALKLLSILLWGELAAWAISADLAERIEDVEAKMAATSQAHDEARHFYVLRDYLRELGEPVPRLGGIGRRLLLGILETDSLVHKLVGMQLLVESNALAIFRGLVDADLEPVLVDLLPYYEKDEARHVGLGVLYLPKLLPSLGRVEAARVTMFQARCVAMLVSAGLPMRDDFKNLGINPRQLAERTVKLQEDIIAQMRGSRRGLVNPRKGVGPKILDFVNPAGGVDSLPPWHQAVLRAWTAGARLADRAFA